jgi:hypothetical protein
MLSRTVTCSRRVFLQNDDKTRAASVVRVPGYRSRGSGSIQIFREVVGLERGPLSLVSTLEELEVRTEFVDII